MLRFILLLLMGLPAAGNAPPVAAPVLPAPAALCGRLSDFHGLRVLELWGSPREAGEAHGYLLAPDIVALFDGYILDEAIVPDVELYEHVILPAVERHFTWSEEQRAELHALHRGMLRRLGEQACRSQKLGRLLTVSDLMVANTLADWFGVLCSTISLWGVHTEDGRVLTARNLDFPPTATMRQQQFVMVRRVTGGRSWVGVTWPGLIGVYTGLNDAGVTILMHDSNGLPPTGGERYTPRSLTLREALETAESASYLTQVEQVLCSRRVLVGNNIHVSGALRPGGGPPAAVFEYDGAAEGRGVTRREPDAGSAEQGSALWCTNHMVARRAPLDSPRYARLARAVSGPAAARALSVAGMFTLIDQVRVDSTVHQVVCDPAHRTMHVRLSADAAPVAVELGHWLAKPIPSPIPAPTTQGAR